MTKPLILVTAILMVVTLAACAAGPNPAVDTPDRDGKTAGFLNGLWHGFILLFTFIWSLFSDQVQVYEVHNSGGWYDLGFLLGVMCFFGGGSGGACKRKR